MADVSGYSLDELYPPLDPALPGVLLRVVVSYAEDCELLYYAEVNGLGAVANAERKTRPPQRAATLFERAAASGLIPVLEWALRRPYEYPATAVAYLRAAAAGHADVLHWLRANTAVKEPRCDINDCKIDVRSLLTADVVCKLPHVAYAAAYGGHAELYQQWEEWNEHIYSIMVCAARGGHSHLVQQQFEDWKFGTFTVRRGEIYDIVAAAAAWGDLGTVQWVRSMCLYATKIEDMPVLVCEAAAHSGNVELLRWLEPAIAAVQNKEDFYCAAARGGSVDAFHLYPPDWNVIRATEVAKQAARHSQVAVLALILDNVEEATVDMWEAAALSGNVAVLHMLAEKFPTMRCDDVWGIVSYTGPSLAGLEHYLWGGNTAALDYALTIGTQVVEGYDDMYYKSAVESGVPDVVQWVRNHCGIDRGYVCTAAVRAGDLSMLHWARAHGYSWGSNMWRLAIESERSSVYVLEFLREHKCPIDAGLDVCAAAAASGSFDTLVWCVRAGFPHSARKIYEYALDNGHKDLACKYREAIDEGEIEEHGELTGLEETLLNMVLT